MERNKFLVFCFAFIPGAGQMYLGMMKKGLVLMGLFCAVCGVAIVLEFLALCIALPLIWFYAFFDTFNSARYLADQRLQMDHRFWQQLREGGWIVRWEGKIAFKSPKILGVGLILLGSYALYETVLIPLSWQFNLPDWMFVILNRVPNVAVAFAVILLGLYLLKREKQNGKEEFVEYREEDHV